MENLNIGRDLLEESSTPGKGYLWDIISMIYYVSIITLTWRDSCIKRWQFSTSTLYHPKFEWASLILKGFWFWDQDARILPCTMFRGPSAGPGRSEVSANNLDREVKGHWKFEKRPGSFRRVFNTLERACEIWYWLIMMNRWSIMYPLSPWRGETAASRDGNFRRAPCIILIQSSNERHSQVSVIFVPFTHPEKVLILGSGCKNIALYNLQGSVSSSWQISGQCKQSGSRGEKAWKCWKEAGIF